MAEGCRVSVEGWEEGVQYKQKRGLWNSKEQLNSGCRRSGANLLQLMHIATLFLTTTATIKASTTHEGAGCICAICWVGQAPKTEQSRSCYLLYHDLFAKYSPSHHSSSHPTDPPWGPLLCPPSYLSLYCQVALEGEATSQPGHLGGVLGAPYIFFQHGCLWPSSSPSPLQQAHLPRVAVPELNPCR